MKTGCDWEHIDSIKPVPYKYFPVNIENFKEKSILKLLESKETNHSKPLKDLICLIFDINKLRQQLFAFPIDSKRMPLGMISEKQLLKAEEYLNQLNKEIVAQTPNQINIRSFSNAFYHCIPHKSDPIEIRTIEQIEEKRDLLDTLSNIEIAYDMLIQMEENLQPIEDPIDYLIEKLNINIEVLDRNCPEFEKIEEYVNNDSGHEFGLKVANIFKIQRKESLNERMNSSKEKLLLWHGSLTTSFASILSKGFQLNPIGVRTMGHTFGTGIYFADLVTKSLGYCYFTDGDPHVCPSDGQKALLLLCEVKADIM